MKQRITYILALATLLLASCSQEDTFPGGGGDRFPMLGLSAVQATEIHADRTGTRAAATAAYPTDKFIGFFVKENTTNGYVACNNRKGEYNAARKLWLPVPDSIWLNNHDADIAVYAPYDAGQTTAATLNLAACLRPADGSKDLWCKKFAANNKSKNLAPVLEHVYSRFIINLSLDATYKGTAPVDSVSLANDSLYGAAAFRPFETAAYQYEGDAGVGFKIAPVKTLTTAAPTASIDLLLIPATLTADIKLSLTVNDITFGVKIASSRFAGKLEAGKQYNANVKLKPTALEVISVTINDWNDETVSKEFEPEFIPEQEPIDIGLDFLIAWGNLRAVKPAGSSTYEYSFAEEQGYYSGVTGQAYDPAGGDYFCWNTLDPSVFNVTQSSWDDARDPCRQIGDGQWQTPTQDQIKKFGELYTAGKAVWGTYAMKDGITKKYGWYFGTETKDPIAKADQDKYVFLPAAGSRYRDSTGTIYAEGSSGYGYYWSTTPNASDASSAYCLRFNSGNVGDGTNSYSRYLGLSLRCVRDK